jgi:hypothetical protein
LVAAMAAELELEKALEAVAGKKESERKRALV